jgi:hypothetical protein
LVSEATAPATVSRGTGCGCCGVGGDMAAARQESKGGLGFDARRKGYNLYDCKAFARITPYGKWVQQGHVRKCHQLHLGQTLF